ncbi:hypothetical protein BDQ17DRAFT_472438 [Cyathus striatus]|nr:hypothetical protein BDQ17DRAFT_472438 [Cyathus striatus]
MFFKFRSKPKVPRFTHPPGWPSPLHNKCSNPQCRHPNLPQAAEGRYDCKGVNSGFYCEGVYYVTADQVQAVMRKHHEDVRREELRRRAEEDEAERQRALMIQQEEARHRDHGPSEHAARYGSERRRQPRGDEHKYDPSRHGLSPVSSPQAPLERRPAQRKHHAADPNVYGPGTFEHPRQVPPPSAVLMHPQQSYQGGATHLQNHSRYVSTESQSSRHAAQLPYTPSRHGRSRAQSRPEVPPRGWI